MHPLEHTYCTPGNRSYRSRRSWRIPCPSGHPGGISSVYKKPDIRDSRLRQATAGASPPPSRPLGPPFPPTSPSGYPLRKAASIRRFPCHEYSNRFCPPYKRIIPQGEIGASFSSTSLPGGIADPASGAPSPNVARAAQRPSRISRPNAFRSIVSMPNRFPVSGNEYGMRRGIRTGPPLGGTPVPIPEIFPRAANGPETGPKRLDTSWTDLKVAGHLPPVIPSRGNRRNC